jgi:hypothetical protein
MEFPSGRISPQSKKNLLVALTVTRTEVRERIVVPELSLEEFVFSAPDESGTAAEKPARRKAPIPAPTESAISLKAWQTRPQCADGDSEFLACCNWEGR